MMKQLIFLFIFSTASADQAPEPPNQSRIVKIGKCIRSVPELKNGAIYSVSLNLGEKFAKIDGDNKGAYRVVARSSSNPCGFPLYAYRTGSKNGTSKRNELIEISPVSADVLKELMNVATSGSGGDKEIQFCVNGASYQVTCVDGGSTFEQRAKRGMIRLTNNSNNKITHFCANEGGKALVVHNDDLLTMLENQLKDSFKASEKEILEAVRAKTSPKVKLARLKNLEHCYEFFSDSLTSTVKIGLAGLKSIDSSNQTTVTN